MFGGNTDDNSFVFALVGACVGMLINVIYGGLIAVFLNMEDKLTRIAKKLDPEGEQVLTSLPDSGTKLDGGEIKRLGNWVSDISDEGLLEMYKTPQRWTDEKVAAINEEVAKRGLVK